MADLALAVAGRVHVGESFIQETLPAGVDITAGDVMTIDKTTGKFILADADNDAKTWPLYVAMTTKKAGLGVTGMKKGVMHGFDLSALSYGDKVFLSATPGKLATPRAGVIETQTVTIGGTPTGGDFKLAFRGVETAAIAFDAAAATVQTALQALASIGAGNATVAGSAGGPYTVTFAGELVREAQPLLTLANNGLTGGTAPGVTIAEGTAGVSRICAGYVIPETTVPTGTSPAKSLFVDL
ncbi:MAG: hypothetical protein WC655_21335 [Candidatus Hydrogenedentales bacterium]|jgi:hypothetical protein